MALNFPSTPTPGQLFTTPAGITYRYDGTSWNAINSSYATGGFRKLDDISSGFDGLTTDFELTVDSIATLVGTTQNLVISLGGVIQEPGVAFTISGSTISFTDTPLAGVEFFGVILGDVGNVGSPSDGTVNFNKLSASVNEYLDDSTAIARQFLLMGA